MSRKSWVLSTVACGTFMATLDSSIVNIALPTLTKALQTDLRSIKWVVIVYLLTITCTLLPFGRLSDLYGRQKVFQAGFLIFIAGSGLCGASTDLSHLILSRIFQGLGASMLMANGPAIITAAFERKQRGKALGFLSMVVSLGLVSGPSVGGFLITNFGWRSIFWVNLPIGLLGFAFAHWRLDREGGKTRPGPFDWGGAFLQFILLLAFIFLVDPPTLNSWGVRPFEISVWVLAFIVFVLGRIFFEVEKQVPEPILDFSLFKIRTFSAANLANFLNFVAYSSLLVLMPFYLEEVLDLSPKQAGFLMSAIPLTVFVIAPLSGYLADRFGTRGLSVMGGCVSSTVLFFMAGAFGSGLNEKTLHPVVLVGLCIVGLASGLFQSPNNVALMSSIPPDKLGVASALMATIRNLGLVTGTGLAAKVFSWKHAETGDFVKAFHAALFVAATLSLGVIGASLLKRDEDLRTDEPTKPIEVPPSLANTPGSPDGKRIMGRKRDKEYSFEEAMHIARQETLPYWFRTDPLFYAGTDEHGAKYPQPIDDRLTEGVWTIFFASTTAWTFDQTMEAYFEWVRRYQALGVRTILVLRDRFTLLKGRTLTEEWLNAREITGFVALDPDGALNNAFGEYALPKLVILKDGAIAQVSSGPTWLDGVEITLGKTLRESSRGIPLLRPWSPSATYADDAGFVALAKDGQPLSLEGFTFVGRWHVDQNIVWTQDHEATLSFTARGSEVNLVAESMTELRSETKVSVLGAGGLLPDTNRAEEAFLDSDGTIALSVQTPSSYAFLRNLPAHQRELVLRFPGAREAPVGIYGFEFANVIRRAE